MYLNLYHFQKAGRWFTQRKIPIFPSIVDLLIFLVFSSKIPFSCEIGEGTKFSHRGIAVIFHPKASVGRDCVIGTCVTLGGKGKGIPGAPSVGDHVYIATGAKLLGPIKVGNNVTIGANSAVLCDVPDGATAVGSPARIIEGDATIMWSETD